MSGGVDSAVAAALLVEQGHDVVGVHMKLHDAPPASVKSASAGHCCGLDDALDARRTADRLGIPFYVLDLREPFKKAVSDTFAAAYLAGRTPNPCVACNGVLKFRVLMSRAIALGADALATGHYARIVDGRRLAIARDPDKDQSYFLFPMTPAAVAKTVFPLGGATKIEVRAHAERLGLPVAAKPESQEVCFVPDDDHTRFVREAAPDVAAAGEIVDEAGQVLGRHDAYYRYTVGQRRGIGVSLGQPAYVVRVEPDTRRVVVTTDPTRVGAVALRASGANWHDRPDPGETVQVRIRHRGALAPATVDAADDGTFVARFHDPVRAVAPGQAAVVYRGEVVLGGGYIDRAGVA
ncbi:MAG: tRNA 2-thiouridine(34) synthase MnmA [Myxococcota bacterium]